MKARVFFGAFLFLFALSANALFIEQLTPFSTSGGAVQSYTFALDPFDTSLGTLDNVRVAIDGQIVVNGTGLGIVPYDLRLGLDFHGFAGQFFDFNDPGMQFIYTGVLPYQSCSIGGCVPVTGPLTIPPTTFSLDYSFDRTFQELTGLDQGLIDNFSWSGAPGATPPTVISGSINDFHETLAGINQMELLVTSLQLGQPLSFTASIGGTISMIYDYTPLEVSAIPVPPAVWLFGTALIGLVGFSKRRKTA